MAPDASTPVFAYSEGVDYIDAPTNTRDSLLGPPFLPIVPEFILAVNQTASSPVISYNDHYLPDPAGDMMDQFTILTR